MRPPAEKAAKRGGYLRMGRVPITVGHSLCAGGFSMRWVFFALLVSLVATCGQKGPLRLPEDEPEGAVGGSLAAVGGAAAFVPAGAAQLWWRVCVGGGSAARFSAPS